MKGRLRKTTPLRNELKIQKLVKTQQKTGSPTASCLFSRPFLPLPYFLCPTTVTETSPLRKQGNTTRQRHIRPSLTHQHSNFDLLVTLTSSLNSPKPTRSTKRPTTSKQSSGARQTVTRKTCKAKHLQAVSRRPAHLEKQVMSGS